MNYKTVTHFAQLWNIDERRVRLLCEQDRIPGVMKVGKTWMIPEDAKKPIDRRFNLDSKLFFDNNVEFQLIDDQKHLIDQARPLSKSIVQQLQDKLVVDWTYNSNAIEGNSLTLSETKVVLENGITIRNKSMKEHLEVINHKEAIYFVQDLVKKETKLTEYDIKSIHQLILKDIDRNNAGKYRLENVIISGASHTPPPYTEVPELMFKLVEMYNNEWQTLHPIVRACYLHGEFVKIHPFVDGNGRIARLLLNFELMKYGYPPIVIKKEDRVLYYDALDKAATTYDYTDFINQIKDLELEQENMYIFLIKK